MRHLGEGPQYASSTRRRELRRALLSVYFHTVGREFEIRGAASVALPPQIQPMSLSGALKVIAESKIRLGEALWRVVQSVPRSGPAGTTSTARYPVAIERYFKKPLTDLDDLRTQFRAGSGAFVSTLIAMRDRDAAVVEALKGVTKATTTSTGFPAALERILGCTDVEFLRQLQETADKSEEPAKRAKRLPESIARLEAETELSIQQLVDQIADIAAYDQFTEGLFEDKRQNMGVKVYPVCTIIKQDTNSMLTTATVTTIIRRVPGPKDAFETLISAIAPENWKKSSDIIRTSRYISDPFTLEPLETTPEFGDEEVPGSDQPIPRLLEEEVKIAWDSRNQQATYHNVLNTATSIRENIEDADVDYNLCRSISSSMLWDRGPGGLQVDQGYIKLRKLGRDAWRMTMRKQVQFSNRNGIGTRMAPQDLSQLVNYLAPAALAYWLEWEMYSLADPLEDDEPAKPVTLTQDELKILRGILHLDNATSPLTVNPSGGK